MALIPPEYLKAVVSIEVDSKDNSGKPTKKSIATGFLLGTLRGEKNDKGEDLYNLSMVTNRHVYEDLKTGQKIKKVYYRLNTKKGEGHYFEINLIKTDNTTLWFKHKDDVVDIAVMPLNPTAMKEADIDFYFFRETDFIFAKDFVAKDISSGDGLFVLGFPMSISGNMRNFVIVRHGVLARADEELLSKRFYYIDASAYPGNSGGPIIHRPEMISIKGTKSNSSAGLMGVVSSGETYSDIAVSQQTQEPRIIFTEQTGLVRVVPIELVVEAINDFITDKKAEEAVPKQIS